ncbi:hypothetical protein C8A03DRAFT_18650 [Achaetomium macrosporum]|uniref:Rhodopsin domain-containing protein n=1 Tax=Achaetomium macrosporum TaxID=79813 RepID=A0AAN7HB28_9PEZI|nr:hypothetical protein C8A03DRAFT_18650 [Achaetomium macrosporum]
MSSSRLGGTGEPVVGRSTPDSDHGDLGPKLITAAFTTWSVAFIFVLLRFWTRSRIVHKLGAADWFIALALLAAGGMCISTVEECKHGMGKHRSDIDIADYGPMMQVLIAPPPKSMAGMSRPQGLPQKGQAWWFALLCYIIALALAKVSICLLYLTVFTIEWARRACYVVLVIVIITNLWGTAAALTYCIPLEATWNPNVVASFCQPETAWWVHTGFVLATDIVIAILPIPIVVPLKLPRRQKLAVVCIFAVGFFICLVSLIRLVILIQILHKDSEDPDFSYNIAKIFYCTVLEVHTAIVVACAMTLKPLIARFLPRFFLSHASKDEHEPSAASSRPPPTIGSRPSRQRHGHQQAVAGEVVGEADVVLRDLEAGMVVVGGGKGSGPGPTVLEVEEAAGSVPSREGNAGRHEEEVVHKPWMRSSDTESQEDLGREMTARSIG